MYLKKSKMYALALEIIRDINIVDGPVPKMKFCIYKYYSCAEWLIMTLEDVKLVIYHGISHFSYELVDIENNEVIVRKVYSNLDELREVFF